MLRGPPGSATASPPGRPDRPPWRRKSSGTPSAPSRAGSGAAQRVVSLRRWRRSTGGPRPSRWRRGARTRAQKPGRSSRRPARWPSRTPPLTLPITLRRPRCRVRVAPCKGCWGRSATSGGGPPSSGRDCPRSPGRCSTTTTPRSPHPAHGTNRANRRLSRLHPTLSSLGPLMSPLNRRLLWVHRTLSTVNRTLSCMNLVLSAVNEALSKWCTTPDSRWTTSDSRWTTLDSHWTVRDSRLATRDSRWTPLDSQRTARDSRWTMLDSLWRWPW